MRQPTRPTDLRYAVADRTVKLATFAHGGSGSPHDTPTRAPLWMSFALTCGEPLEVLFVLLLASGTARSFPRR